ncbi:MAG: hypothetical protein F4104_08000, partial [Gemmatimonadetes bacterium]|nr:hypothetical protein [Gemmatimonadota bacterium]
MFENEIARWRTYVERHGALPATELNALEARLRVQAGDLLRLGLPAEEAFQVAVGRISRDDPATRAFVQVHAVQLMGAAPDEPATDETGKIDVTDNIDIAPRFARPRLTEFIFVLCLTAGAALAIKVPALFGYAFDDDDVNQFYALNISFFAFPFVTAYFAWKRGMDFARWGWLIPPFFVAMLLCNV